MKLRNRHPLFFILTLLFVLAWSAAQRGSLENCTVPSFGNKSGVIGQINLRDPMHLLERAAWAEVEAFEIYRLPAQVPRAEVSLAKQVSRRLGYFEAELRSQPKTIAVPASAFAREALSLAEVSRMCHPTVAKTELRIGYAVRFFLDKSRQEMVAQARSDIFAPDNTGMATLEVIP